MMISKNYFIFLLSLFAVTFATTFVSAQTPLTACGTISASGSYILSNDVSSTGTCFDITTNDVTLDCNNRKITYATTDIGYGVQTPVASAFSDNFNTIIIKNCEIIQGSQTTDSHGIFFHQVRRSMVTNTKITTSGIGSYGIRDTTFFFGPLSLSTASTVYSSLKITTSGDGAVGMAVGTIHGTIGDIIDSVEITTLGAASNGINWKGRNSGIIRSNKITTSGSASAGIYDSSLNGASTIHSNHIITTGSDSPAFRLGGSVLGNQIYNNIFDAQGTPINVQRDSSPGSLTNYWSVNSGGFQCGQQNILGGDTMGGNAYFGQEQFSNTCANADGDTFCDQAKLLFPSPFNPQNDNFPLIYGSVPYAPCLCGNGLVETGFGEQCDDANKVDGDGCSSVCSVEIGYICTGEPSICTSSDQVCDNGVVEGTEVCDPSGSVLSSCDTGALGLCAYGDQVCDAGCGSSSCQQTVFPSAEICDGLDNSCNGAIDEGIDTDFDGFNDCTADACIGTSGQFQGCPVGDKNIVTFHTVNIGGTTSTALPLAGVEVRVFDRNNANFRLIAGSKNPDGSLYGIVFEADQGKIGSCITDGLGICIAGEAQVGDYLVIIKYYDSATGKTVYVGRPKSPSDFKNGLATKDFQVIKVLKNG